MKPILALLVPMTLALAACAQEPEPVPMAPSIAPEPVYDKSGKLGSATVSTGTSAVCPAGTVLTTGTDGNPYCVGS